MYHSLVEFLRHILDECIYLEEEYRNNSFEYFTRDPRLSKAVCRSLEIIGEAVHYIPDALKTKYPLVSWREMNDIRNKIIHHYFGIDYDIVWDTIKTDIPVLKEAIETIIEREKESE